MHLGQVVLQDDHAYIDVNQFGVVLRITAGDDGNRVGGVQRGQGGMPCWRPRRCSDVVLHRGIHRASIDDIADVAAVDQPESPTPSLILLT